MITLVVIYLLTPIGINMPPGDFIATSVAKFTSTSSFNKRFIRLITPYDSHPCHFDRHGPLVREHALSPRPQLISRIPHLGITFPHKL